MVSSLVLFSTDTLHYFPVWLAPRLFPVIMVNVTTLILCQKSSYCSALHYENCCIAVLLSLCYIENQREIIMSRPSKMKPAECLQRAKRRLV
jgi:hypothetical protein